MSNLKEGQNSSVSIILFIYLCYMLKICISLDVISFISCILFIADDVIITDECYYSITVS